MPSLGKVTACDRCERPTRLPRHVNRVAGGLAPVEVSLAFERRLGAVDADLRRQLAGAQSHRAQIAAAGHHRVERLVRSQMTAEQLRSVEAELTRARERAGVSDGVGSSVIQP